MSEDLPISCLGLDTRVHNCLTGAGIKTMQALAALDRVDIRLIPNLGNMGSADLTVALARFAASAYRRGFDDGWEAGKFARFAP